MRKFYFGLLSILAGLAALPAAAAINGNMTPMVIPQAYSPVLKGQTEDPGVAYTTQQGKFFVLGNMVYVDFNIVTSGTTTKTTTTDLFAVSLPFTSVTLAGNYDALTCNIQNATAVTLGLTGIVGSNTAQVTFNGYDAIVAGKATPITWAATTPGIGVLSNVITAKCSGWYQAAL